MVRTNLSDRGKLASHDPSIPIEYIREIMSDIYFYGLNVHVQTKTKNMDKYIQNFF